MSLGVETQRGRRCEAPASFGTHDDEWLSSARQHKPTAAATEELAA